MEQPKSTCSIDGPVVIFRLVTGGVFKPIKLALFTIVHGDLDIGKVIHEG